MKNYYEILEVNNKASKEVIDRAYRVLIKKYHPDLYVGEEKFFAEKKVRDLNEAYKILSDNFLREQYDAELIKEQFYDNQFNNKNIEPSNKYNEKLEAKQNVNFENRFNNSDQSNEENIHRIGTIGSLIDLTKEVFKGLSLKGREKKKLQEEDIKAGFITAVIMIVLLIILWFIPFTKGFIRGLFPF